MAQGRTETELQSLRKGDPGHLPLDLKKPSCVTDGTASTSGGSHRRRRDDVNETCETNPISTNAANPSMRNEPNSPRRFPLSPVRPPTNPPRPRTGEGVGG